MKVKEILKTKGPEVFTVGEHKTIYDAMQILINNNIGVLLVINETGKIVGIISERDIIRAAFKNTDNFANMSISDVMTKKIIFALDEDELEYVESVMTRNRIRHLPVMHNKILVGLISIGDIVKALRSGKEFENKYLIDYIQGSVK